MDSRPDLRYELLNEAVRNTASIARHGLEVQAHRSQRSETYRRTIAPFGD